MPWFIKTEKFTERTKLLPKEKIRGIIQEHKSWVEEMKASGIKIWSGYLVDKKDTPGGGGLLILKKETFELATELIKDDPMIKKNLVIWELNKWIRINDDLIF